MVILLHQTDGGGLCGWLPFMGTYLDRRVSFLAVDLCRYGESRCNKVEAHEFEEADQTDMVDVAIRHATTAMDARHIVVMGASMGGSIALMSATSSLEVDAAVDLSGPADWPGMKLVREGRALRVPVLVGMATDEGPDEVSAARLVVHNAPAGSHLLTTRHGHGYELLNEIQGQPRPLGRAVIRWIERTL